MSPFLVHSPAYFCFQLTRGSRCFRRVKNSLSPNWTKIFNIDYTMGTPVKIAISIFDEVRKGDNKGMGSAVFDVAEVLGSRGNTKAKKLKKGGT